MTRTGSAQLVSALFSSMWMASATVALAGEPPMVQFDIPRRLVAHNVLSTAEPPTSRLVEVTVPVSARVVSGDVRGVKEIVVEIDAGTSGLVVHDFAPQTTLGSELASDIQVVTTNEKAKTFDASLGGHSPIPIGDIAAQVTPSISVGLKDKKAETQTLSRLSPKQPVVVSGTINDGRGVFYQLRPSSQTTLEGQHGLSVVFRVPSDWVVGRLDVRCWAKGERQVLWFDQPQVWGSTQRAVSIAMAGLEVPTISARRHLVAKQPTTEVSDNWVPTKEVSAKEEGK